MEPFEVTHVLERADLTRALRAYPEINRRRWLAFAVLSAIWVAVLLGFGPRGLNAVICGLMLAVTALLTLGTPWIAPMRSRPAIGIGRPIRWAFGPRGVRFASSLGTTDIPWTHVADLRVGGDRASLLLRSPRMVFALPRGMSPEQAAAVRDWWERAERTPAETPPAGPATPATAAEAPERIVARGLPTPAQTLALQRIGTALKHPRRRVTLPVVSGLLAAAVFLVAVPAEERGELAEVAPILGLAVALLVAGSLALGAVLSRVLAPLIARRLPRRIWGDQPVTWWFEPDGLGIDARASSAVPWSRVREVRVRQGLLVVVLEPHMLIGVPLEAFAPGDAARVLELARAAGAPVHRSAPSALAKR